MPYFFPTELNNTVITSQVKVPPRQLSVPFLTSDRILLGLSTERKRECQVHGGSKDFICADIKLAARWGATLQA